MTGELRPSGDDDIAIVDAAIRLARQISKALGARRSRPPSDEAERAAISREAFQHAADVTPIELPEVR